MATCSLRDKLLLLQTSLTFSCWVPLSYQCVELGRSLWFAVYVYTLLACTFIFMAYIGFVIYRCSPGLGWRVHLRETAAQMKIKMSNAHRNSVLHICVEVKVVRQKFHPLLGCDFEC